MIGTTLADLRDRVESLAEETGSYVVRCGRTGERPTPVGGLRFEDRATARAALQAAEQYRSALRRYDPRTPYYDLIVCEDTGPLGRAESTASAPSEPTPLGPLRRRTSPGSTRRRRIEFSHRVAAAVFEALSDGPHDRVETAIMDRYFDLAEFTCTTRPTGDGDTLTVVATFSEYALEPRDGRLPVLPLVIELYRRGPRETPAALDVVDHGEGWRLTIEFGDGSHPDSLSRAAISGQE